MKAVEFYYEGNDLVTTKLDDYGNVIELSSLNEIYKKAEYDEFNNQILYYDKKNDFVVKRKFKGFRYIIEYFDSYGNFWCDELKIPFFFTKHINLDKNSYNEFNSIF